MKLSIITVNYNNSNGLQKTIESVKAQNYSDMEYIVIDGGSTDGSINIIKQNKSFINLWISEKDNGVYHAMNKGIKIATGEYLLFLNSGDHFFSNEVLLKNEKHFYEKDIICFDIIQIGYGLNLIYKHPDNIDFSYLFEETFAHQSAFIKLSLFDKVGYYDESLKIVADWKFFIHAFTYYNCTYKTIHETLSVYYFGGMSSSGQGPIVRKSERKKVLMEDFSIFYNDYINLKNLSMNRFKMLSEIEKTVFGKKLVSLIFRIYIMLFSKVKLKDLIK